MINPDTIFRAINSIEKSLLGKFTKGNCKECKSFKIKNEEIQQNLKKKKIIFEIEIEMLFVDKFLEFRLINSIKDFHRSFLCEEYIIQETESKQKEIYLTRDFKFVIKIISKDEFNKFKEISEAYFNYFDKAPFSRLVKIYGIYKIFLYKFKTKEKNNPHYIIIMDNVIHRNNLFKMYDLKGSSYGRYSNKNKFILKDNNWLKDEMSLNIPLNEYKQLITELDSDFRFLEFFGLMDYSLVIGIYAEKPDTDNYYKVITKCLPNCINDIEKNKYLICNDSSYSLNLNKPGQMNYKLFYSIGIVDILTEYDCTKKMENCFKAFLCIKGRSCYEPKLYRRRLFNFLFINGNK